MLIYDTPYPSLVLRLVEAPWIEISHPREKPVSHTHALCPFTTSDFEKPLDELVDSCRDSKTANPSTVRSSTEVDQQLLQAATAVADDGVDLADLVSRFARDVLPASLKFSSPSYLTHPHAGYARASVLSDIATAFMQQRPSSIDYLVRQSEIVM